MLIAQRSSHRGAVPLSRVGRRLLGIVCGAVVAVGVARTGAAQTPAGPPPAPASRDTGSVRGGAQGVPQKAVLPATQPAAQPPAQPNDAWRIIEPPQSSLVYGRGGSLIGEIGKELRTSVPIGSLPVYVPEAFVAIEDRRFYQHNGVDVIGVIGAIKDR